MKTNDSSYDAIVVGTGPGGATTARELARRNRRVLILEWGSGEALRGTTWQAFKWGGVPGKSFLVTHGMLGIVRGICPGGSSVFYYGTCFKTPLAMLARYGIDIKDEIAEARRELPIAPLGDALVAPMASRIMESARGLGYDWQLLDKFYYQERWRPEYAFGHYGDPHRVKWYAGMFLEDALAHGATIRYNAKVTEVLCEKGRAVGVSYVSGQRLHKVYAEKIILAAGGIGTPVVLRKSGIVKAGYDFFFDPVITACGIVNDMTARGNEIPMTAGIHLEEEGYMMTDMPVPFLLDMGFAAAACRFHRMLSNRSTLRIMIKAKDSLGGHLTDSGGVRKRLADADKEKLIRGYERAREILDKAGAKGIFKSWTLATHPGGTVKVGELLDAALQTEYQNLHVCDCSVIPEPWGLPPTLTLIGLGKHLARVLTGEKRLSAQ